MRGTSGPTARDSGQGHRIEEMCGISDQYKINMATMMKEKQIEDEEVTKAAKYLAEMNGVPRQEIEHIKRMKKEINHQKNILQNYLLETKLS